MRCSVPTFHDSDGNEWVVKISIDLALRLRDDYSPSIDLTKASDIAQLVANEALLFGVLWRCVEVQAAGRNIDALEFDSLLSTERSATDALEAFTDALQLFFQSHCLTTFDRIMANLPKINHQAMARDIQRTTNPTLTNGM